MMKKTIPYDTSKYLDDDETISLYLSAALEEGDPKLVAAALGDIAKARGMTEIAKQTGLSRESLYRSFSAEGNPSLDTLMKVIKAFGLQLEITKATKPEPGRTTELA